MRNKVLLVSPYSEKKIGGIATWTNNVLEYCKVHKIKNIVLLNTLYEFKSNLVRNICLRIILGLLESVLIYLRFVSILIKNRPTSIHYTSSASFALFRDYLFSITARIFRIKFIIHWRFGRIPELYKKMNWEWYLIEKVIEKSSASIVIDKKSLEVFKKNKNVVYLPNPISLSLQKRAIDYRINMIHRKKGKIVFVGHIIKEKGVFELVNACLELKSVLELSLIGPVLQDVKREIIKIAQRRSEGKWVQWKGKLDHERLYDELASASVLCLPSYTEGFPNVVIEAMANKCPVIATEVGAIYDIIKPNEPNPSGICVPVKDTKSLSKAIEELLDNEDIAIKMGENGYESVLEHYTMDIIFPKYEALWNQ